MLNQAVDSLCKNALEVALSGSAACISRHHARNRGIGTQQGSKFGGGFKLGRKNTLKHGKKKVLFPAFVLVSVKGEHDGLKKGVNLGERDKTT